MSTETKARILKPPCKCTGFGATGPPTPASDPRVPCVVLGAPSPTTPRTRVARYLSVHLAELVPWTGAPWTVLSGMRPPLGPCCPWESGRICRARQGPQHTWGSCAAHGRAGGSAGPGRGRSTLWGRGMLPMGERGDLHGQAMLCAHSPPAS